jgi:hypothetical protein
LRKEFSVTNFTILKQNKMPTKKKAAKTSKTVKAKSKGGKKKK